MHNSEKERSSVWRHQLGRALSSSGEGDDGPRRQRWRARPWLWAALVGVGLLTAAFYRPRSTDGSWHAKWNLRQWHFGPYETREEMFAMLAHNPPPPFTLVTKGYRLGPLQVFTMRREAEPQPLGTLYDPHSRNQIGRVLRVEKRHEFEDERVEPGVLVRAANGTEVWTPRAKMEKVLVGR
jgi:hypothetical protein